MARSERRTQAERSREMRARLIQAAIDSLIEQGHARTTAVEVCKRAGVTRGALHHHFDDLAALLAAAMSEAYDRYFVPREEAALGSLEAWVDRAWSRLQRPQFKAVIEVWLAARNQPELEPGLRPAIEKYQRLFSIDGNAVLRKRFKGSRKMQAFYRLAAETMIGLALGRATSPAGRPLAHEALVVAQLRELAKQAMAG